jgi:hypothetical protein
MGCMRFVMTRVKQSDRMGQQEGKRKQQRHKGFA